MYNWSRKSCYMKRTIYEYEMHIQAFQPSQDKQKYHFLFRFLKTNAYLCTMFNNEKVTYIFVFILMLTACNGLQTSEQLDQIDSLVVEERYDSASVLLSKISEKPMTKDEHAHYILLSTQIAYLTHRPLPPDSLLDMVLAYYKKVGNNQKLAETYYYKSARYETDNNYSKALLYGKEAERLAAKTDDLRLQFKIAESLGYLNGMSGNDALQLKYAKDALAIAQKVENKNWIAYSYNSIIFAFANLGQYDSVYTYIERSIPYIDYVYDSDKAGFLTNIGLLYKDKDSGKAKEFFEKALVYDELPETIEHLADVYYSEGNREKAYNLWKKALTKPGGARYEKDNLLHSILSYDLEHGNIDEVSKNVDEIISIKDSILIKLKNDTIKDLQVRFDKEVAKYEADKKLGRMQKIVMTLAIVLVLLAFFIYFRRKEAETKEREYQNQLYAYTTEINQMTANRDNALSRIRELESKEEKDQQKINQLEEDVDKADSAIKLLNKCIEKMLNDEAPKLKQGKMLYDEIVEGGTIVKWQSKEKELFNNYYAAINYQSYNRLRKIKRATPLSAHNMFYLILKEMGYSDEEVRRIVGLSPEGLRSIRKRTKPIDQE